MTQCLHILPGRSKDIYIPDSLLFICILYDTMPTHFARRGSQGKIQFLIPSRYLMKEGGSGPVGLEYLEFRQLKINSNFCYFKDFKTFNLGLVASPLADSG